MGLSQGSAPTRGLASRTWNSGLSPCRAPKQRPQTLHSHVTWGADTRTLGGTLGTQAGDRGGEGLLRGRPPSTLGSQGLLRDHSFGCPLSTQEKPATFPSSQPGYTKHMSCWALCWALDGVLQPGPSGAHCLGRERIRS